MAGRVVRTLAFGAVAVGASGLLAGAATLAAARAAREALLSSKLRDRVVLITGGSRGLGFALALECSRLGGRLAICARDPEMLEEAVRKLRRHGAEVLSIVCDVSRREEIAAMIDRVVSHYGGIDVLINNAGIISVGPFATQTEKDFEQAMDVMFWGMLHTTMLALPHMRQGARIINITSVGGKMAVPHLLPYSAAKFAAVGFSEGLSAELASEGIHVLTVVPGLMRTGSHLNAWFKGNHSAEYTWFGISATSPLMAMDARRAARRIVGASLAGRRELLLGIPAKLATRLHGVAPGTTVRAMELVNRLMPAGNAGQPPRRGHQVENLLTRSPLTALGRSAARSWNQQKLA